MRAKPLGSNGLPHIACLINFTLDSEDLLSLYKQKSDFYELWLQHKQLETMEMNEA